MSDRMYLVQSRAALGHGARQAFRGKSQMAWTPWRTRARHDTERDAVADCDRFAAMGGLDQHRVRHGNRTCYTRGC